VFAGSFLEKVAVKTLPRSRCGHTSLGIRSGTPSGNPVSHHCPDLLSDRQFHVLTAETNDRVVAILRPISVLQVGAARARFSDQALLPGIAPLDFRDVQPAASAVSGRCSSDPQLRLRSTVERQDFSSKSMDKLLRRYRFLRRRGVLHGLWKTSVS